MGARRRPLVRNVRAVFAQKKLIMRVLLNQNLTAYVATMNLNARMLQCMVSIIRAKIRPRQPFSVAPCTRVGKGIVGGTDRLKAIDLHRFSQKGHIKPKSELIEILVRISFSDSK
jgi:hypothetical protein